jgi:benzoyl-CoA reductase subunit D
VNPGSTVLITGGLAADDGFVAVMRELGDGAKLDVDIRGHELSVHAGAIGAAIWAGFRHLKLNEVAA